MSKTKKLTKKQGTKWSESIGGSTIFVSQGSWAIRRWRESGDSLCLRHLCNMGSGESCSCPNRSKSSMCERCREEIPKGLILIFRLYARTKD